MTEASTDAPRAAPLLRLEGVTVDLQASGSAVRILDGVDLVVDRGEIVGLVGESGSGKSMTARAILRLLPDGAAAGGRALLDGQEIPPAGSPALRRIRAQRIGMIFQDPRAHIDPLYRAEHHICEGLRVHHGHGRSTARARAADLLASVGIDEPERVLAAYPHQLSGGMLQRVLIAGALAGDPDILIADEPTTALDVTIQAEILAIFDALRRERRVGVLFVTHDLELAATLCDRVAVMYAGRVVEEQPAADLFTGPLHPYTRGLLLARPLLDARRRHLPTIPGRPPDPGERPSGCAFHPRCAFRAEACERVTPELREVRKGRRSACLRVDALADALAAEVAGGG